MRTRVFRTLTAALAALSSLALFFSFAAPASAQTEEAIRSFAVDALVREDGRVAVTERIEYEFPEPRHGIYRDIPVRYRDDTGKMLEIPIEVLGVDDGAGRAWNYEVQKNGVYLRIKIGDADSTITGRQTYSIRYEASGALRYFDDHDEFYWNATGDAWTVPIERVNMNVRLPASVAQSDITMKCFTGPTGSTAQDCLANSQGPSAQFVSDAGPLTVVVGWPKGKVAVLEAKKPFAFFGLNPDYLPFLLPILVFAGLIVTWWKHGRDAAGFETSVVQYEPPEGMRPAEVGTLVDENAGLTDILATIVDLAVRGYLKIREVEKQGLIFKSQDYEFERLKDYFKDESLRSYEHGVLDVLFGGNGKIRRASEFKEDYSFSKKLPDLKKRLYEGLAEAGLYSRSPDATRNAFIGGGIAIAVAGTLGLSWMTAAVLPTATMNAVIASLVSGCLIALFAPFMPSRTAKGAQALWHAEGFKEYLAKAEKYRIQWQESENVFEKFLPYAMVFGVADKWAKALADMAMKAPDWYEGRTPMAQFNSVAFVAGLSTLNSSMMTAMKATPPQTSSGSGFSGGGSSGGGGGGGGGGSW